MSLWTTPIDYTTPSPLDGLDLSRLKPLTDADEAEIERRFEELMAGPFAAFRTPVSPETLRRMLP